MPVEGVPGKEPPRRLASACPSMYISHRLPIHTTSGLAGPKPGRQWSQVCSSCFPVCALFFAAIACASSWAEDHCLQGFQSPWFLWGIVWTKPPA